MCVCASHLTEGQALMRLSNATGGMQAIGSYNGRWYVRCGSSIVQFKYDSEQNQNLLIGGRVRVWATQDASRLKWVVANPLPLTLTGHDGSLIRAAA